MLDTSQIKCLNNYQSKLKDKVTLINTIYDGYLKNYSKTGEIIDYKSFSKDQEFKSVNSQIEQV